MDWILSLGTAAAFLVVIGYGINSLLKSRRVTVFPLLRVEEGGTPRTILHVMHGPNSGKEEKGSEEMVSVEQIISKKGVLKISRQDSAQRAAAVMAEYGVGSLRSRIVIWLRHRAKRRGRPTRCGRCDVTLLKYQAGGSHPSKLVRHLRSRAGV